ncbi:trifunctional transcriptional regulator/proline dehydrogenase/L-glutamate gamma-semialdehyde dehydrogenase [Azospirillum sp. RWY-5-1]|uniref:Bifunctional protein PutA n=1 Tax=Azospirillum oleiclasticum TaxID=2735135 RepID=A0ABX2TJ47_9PROT|nr:trifunctional transcriptional regulator/proline dehydrogenase/L-glutamate gamma-semialdehyde dehydrogenase [Azospirillum oleiclasticum]NYZ17146.1 trifunctional transcriptional regulator/proline dehydrogenase/L-glutamate gamma-semialdehyde dehydrogenase [Azospirillum oleiclasticum]NYZ24283.1 trifunctional transcriptional regulator/proline dehydrogenase/L-glutamate gamma-semialdehyde dehydrogenase [Azospirillum oleiclasticum]
MGSTTIGVKVDDLLRDRLKAAAERTGRSPHWLIKQSILATLERVERGEPVDGLFTDQRPAEEPAAEEAAEPTAAPQPFLEFAQTVQPQSVLRAKITAAYRRPEPECLPFLIAEATLPAPVRAQAQEVARRLAESLRGKARGGGVEGLIHEYSLSSQEGVALMCLAEALLRIPDRATRDALIRDKIGVGDWESHIGHSPSLFVNAATWGLVVTGRLTGTSSAQGLSAALTKLIGRGGEPLIRKGVDIAMRMMGEQFVTGQTIAEALANSRKMEAKGFRYSYDMLGEAAVTARDAERYYADYEQAIHAIGRAAGRRGIYEGPGISVKLSALHPRYSRAQADRVMAELLPRLTALTLLARRYDIGLNIDAEEADRLELSLDLLERLCFHPELAGWNGIGFVVQAYQKRAPFVLDFVIDLARRSGHRLMLRLVKGAYWDSEIKRAQVDGLEGFPVFTRKVHTDVSYIACARKLLAAPDAVYPQFATHNAHTTATIHAMAGPNYYAGQYEFQCLHGMGEPLYEEVVDRDGLNRPCRIYAPVGTHEALLAYLVRRLLENGANTSFVNRVADADVPIEALIADPVEQATAIQPLGSPHPKLALPRRMFGEERENSAGLDLSNEQRLASLSAALLAGAEHPWRAVPLLADGPRDGVARAVRNPADHRDTVGSVIEADAEMVAAAFTQAVTAGAAWQATPAADRAACLLRAADLMERRMPVLLGLIVREAGKSLPNAVAEVREAVDFLRYYGTAVKRGFSNDTHRPLGPVVCISPWNFPMAIFTGQVAAALAAGNPVLAKPAEETPLIAAEAVRLLHEAGVPHAALQFLPGDGSVGAALVADARVRGVMFTGSTEVARLIQRQLAGTLDAQGRPIPLIAETGGQNALIVDSSALPEQVVGDVIASAFDSAGQRCSALRVLCVQEEAADRVLTMLRGALAELSVGNPDRLSTDVGPVITAEAQRIITDHIKAMRAKGHRVESLELPPATRAGTFVAPTVIEIDGLSDLTREVFGPVLHVLRFRRDELDELVDSINATGYGLTFGVHSRIDETIARVAERIAAGNVYVNRNLIGAVVGVQPFGGGGLSGTGPKAGGPLYLLRLLSARPPVDPDLRTQPERRPAQAAIFRDWLAARGHKAEAGRCAAWMGRSPAGTVLTLPGPVGERNLYALHPRGTVLCLPQTETGLCLQLGAAFATGNHALVQAAPALTAILRELPATLRERVAVTEDWPAARFDTVLFEGESDALRAVNQTLADRDGPLLSVQGAAPDALTAGTEDYALAWLVEERAISTNTAAAGGNASLMTIG